MSIKSLKNKTRSGSLLIGNPAFSPGDFIALATVTVGSGGSASINFTNIPQTYQHLQVRYVARGETSLSRVGIRLNSDTGNNYSQHGLFASGSSTGAYSDLNISFIDTTVCTTSSDPANTFAGGIVEIMDYKDTNKFKTVRCLGGFDKNGSGYIGLSGGHWRNTNAITAITFTAGTFGGGNFAQNSRFALYGIGGA